MSDLQEGQQVEVIRKTRFRHGFHIGDVVTLVKRDADDDSWWASGPAWDGDPNPLGQWIGQEDIRAIDTPAIDSAAPAEAPQDHGPLAAHLSERTLDKVLSRPAYVPSLVLLDRDAAAQRLADAVADYLAMPTEEATDLRKALADYRATVQS